MLVSVLGVISSALGDRVSAEGVALRKFDWRKHPKLRKWVWRKWDWVRSKRRLVLFLKRVLPYDPFFRYMRDHIWNDYAYQAEDINAVLSSNGKHRRSAYANACVVWANKLGLSAELLYERHVILSSIAQSSEHGVYFRRQVVISRATYALVGASVLLTGLTCWSIAFAGLWPGVLWLFFLAIAAVTFVFVGRRSRRLNEDLIAATVLQIAIDRGFLDREDDV